MRDKILKLARARVVPMAFDNTNISMLKELIKFANDLDSKGLIKEADALDLIIISKLGSSREEELEYAIFKGRPSEPGPYYHGTSDKFGLKPGDSLRPPSESGVQTERRRQRRGKIFFTNNIESARFYANRAVKVHGGAPIIYEIEPKVRVKQISSREGTQFGPAFHTDAADIIKVIEPELSREEE